MIGTIGMKLVDLNKCTIVMGHYEDVEDGQENVFAVLIENLEPSKKDLDEELVNRGVCKEPNVLDFTYQPCFGPLNRYGVIDVEVNLFNQGDFLYIDSFFIKEE